MWTSKEYPCVFVCAFGVPDRGGTTTSARQQYLCLFPVYFSRDREKRGIWHWIKMRFFTFYISFHTGAGEKSIFIDSCHITGAYVFCKTPWVEFCSAETQASNTGAIVQQLPWAHDCCTVTRIHKACHKDYSIQFKKTQFLSTNTSRDALCHNHLLYK